MITLNQSYTYEELLRNLQESGTQYPESTIYKKVGESHDERPIPMLRVGSGLDTLILTAGIHWKRIHQSGTSDPDGTGILSGISG